MPISCSDCDLFVSASKPAAAACANSVNLPAAGAAATAKNCPIDALASAILPDSLSYVTAVVAACAATNS